MHALRTFFFKGQFNGSLLFKMWRLFTLQFKSFHGASLVAQMVKNLPAMQETWVQSLGWEDLLEKEIATYSSILAWGRIPWTEEPGRLKSIGLQRIRHDWAMNFSFSSRSFCYMIFKSLLAGHEHLSPPSPPLPSCDSFEGVRKQRKYFLSSEVIQKQTKGQTSRF